MLFGYREDMEKGGEYWRNKWNEYENKYYRDQFYSNIDNVYEDMYHSMARARTDYMF